MSPALSSFTTSRILYYSFYTLLLSLESCPSLFVPYYNFLIFLNSCRKLNKNPNLEYGSFNLTLVLLTQKPNLETAVLFGFMLIGLIVSSL